MHQVSGEILVHRQPDNLITKDIHLFNVKPLKGTNYIYNVIKEMIPTVNNFVKEINSQTNKKIRNIPVDTIMQLT